MEAFIISLVGIIGFSFVAEMIFAQPVLSDVAGGFIPSIPDDTALYIAIGIIGATGMVGQRFASLLENHPWFTVKIGRAHV